MSLFIGTTHARASNNIHVHERQGKKRARESCDTLEGGFEPSVSNDEAFVSCRRIEAAG